MELIMELQVVAIKMEEILQEENWFWILEFIISVSCIKYRVSQKGLILIP